MTNIELEEELRKAGEGETELILKGHMASIRRFVNVAPNLGNINIGDVPFCPEGDYVYVAIDEGEYEYIKELSQALTLTPSTSSSR